MGKMLTLNLTVTRDNTCNSFNNVWCVPCSWLRNLMDINLQNIQRKLCFIICESLIMLQQVTEKFKRIFIPNRFFGGISDKLKKNWSMSPFSSLRAFSMNFIYKLNHSPIWIFIFKISFKYSDRTILWLFSSSNQCVAWLHPTRWKFVTIEVHCGKFLKCI